MKLFDSAALKLTMWYLLIVMAISITFSVIIYQISSNEIGRDFVPRGPNNRQLILDLQQFQTLQQERIDEALGRLVGNLVVLNVFTLAIGGGASYLLARRTLSPIKDAMDEQSRFISDASHELRTPLASMRTEIEVALRQTKPSASKMKELLISNLEEVDTLRALTDRLLQLTSEKKLILSPTALDDIATEAINRVLPLAQSKQISIENTVAKIHILGNSDSLADMVTILLDNAIKYSPEKTRIVISSDVHSKYAALHVQDEGKGIKATELPHIFDRFYRADVSRNKQQIDGHGLGLAIASRIASLHNSKITVASKPDVGSTFSIKLPLVSPE